MPYPVFVEVRYRDAQEREGYETVRLDTDLADTLDNMSAIMAKVDTINTECEALSAASVLGQRIIIDVERTYVAPNEFADLGEYAFVRLQDTVTKENYYVRVPAPDMLLYDANQDGILGPLFQAAFLLFQAAIVHPETGNDFDYEYAQLRQRKRFRKLA